MQRTAEEPGPRSGGGTSASGYLSHESTPAPKLLSEGGAYNSQPMDKDEVFT